MLIEFSVANLRSFKEKQTLSMVANNKDKKLPDNVIDLDMPGLSKVRLVKSVAIYGANASGKSNLFKAAEFMRNFVVNSATELKPDEETGVVPFKLDSECEKEPSEFEVIFIHDKVRYQYGFAVDKNRVFDEWLYAFPHGQPQCWFTRTWDKDQRIFEWKFSTYLKGEKESLKEKTRSNTLFLSMAAQFNHEQLTKVYNFYSDNFLCLEGSDVNPEFTALLMEKNCEISKSVKSMIRQADLGISNIEINVGIPDNLESRKKSDKTEKAIIELLKKNELSRKKKLPENYRYKKLISLNMIHEQKKTRKLVTFLKEDESEGTIKFFSLIGHFLYLISNGYFLIIDEIGAKIHPLLIRNLIQIIHNSTFNKRGSQLIFTLHDTTLLDQDLFRRDQIWFTEKNNEGATILYPLTDYKPRNDEALQKGYLAGRYGAIPFLSEFTFQ
ncbi:MAG: ATP-binding protein [Candidatus Omnitrophota bacterium]|jgi:AAA15 family ATPase/GTPase|nr:MAG: ATP-binding protein [Candidatus Omnitrophota bacterium]